MPTSLPGWTFLPSPEPPTLSPYSQPPLGHCYLDILQASETQNMQTLSKVILIGSDRLISGFHDTKEYTQSFPLIDGNACRRVEGRV